MYAIRIQDTLYRDAAQLVFGGVTSRPPRQATLLVASELPSAERALLEQAFQSSCSGKIEVLRAPQLNLAQDEIATRIHLDGSQRRETIEGAFLAAVRAHGVGIERWNVAEVPLARG